MTAKLPATDHVSRFIRLAEWAREKGYKLGPVVTVGDVTAQLVDIRQEKIEGRAMEPAPGEEDGGPYDGLDAVDEPADGTGG
jgi:hypothetical protein